MAHREDRPNPGPSAEGPDPPEIAGMADYALLPVAIVLWDMTERVVYANPTALELLGSTERQALGRSVGEMLCRSVGDERPAEPTGAPLVDRLSGRLVLTRVDGVSRFVEVRSVPTLDRPDGQLHVLSTIIDRTAEAEMERALKTEHDLLQTVIDTMPDLIYMKDRQSRFTRVNQAQAANGGFSDPGLMLGRTDFDIYPPEFARMIFDEEQSAMSTKKAILGRVENQTERFGRPLWIQSTKVPIVRNGEAIGLVGISRDITELQLVQERLRYQALHDSLTGLPNRVLMMDRLEQAVLTSRRERSSFALCLLDLDRFKEVNDTHGHLRGDRLLQEVAKRVHGVLRGADTVARLGGDEFAVILLRAGEEGATATARRIHYALAQPLDLDGHNPDTAASIGIVVFPLHAEDAATLLVYADVAMYAAKAAGGGFVVYDSAWTENSPHHLT